MIYTTNAIESDPVLVAAFDAFGDCRVTDIGKILLQPLQLLFGMLTQTFRDDEILTLNFYYNCHRSTLSLESDPQYTVVIQSPLLG